ncbi:hypothetical protein ETAA1_25340 [Urbifossiella limnaea]|uniref:Uncharacterized protein n=1 Tax=Urbifossiella limnaea TaxID=2528023 RepID=A0A517XST7_9BACT|nr:hypothetical protein ETAA1_25340 [Urbifossiella limnaea]
MPRSEVRGGDGAGRAVWCDLNGLVVVPGRLSRDDGVPAVLLKTAP